LNQYKLTPVARRGLRDVYGYVRRHFGIDTAESVIERLLEAFRRLAATPGMGHLRSDLTSDSTIRFWSVGPTLIAYRYRNSSVEILLVERSRRNWATLLEELDA
jgi:plasmid stabilization system protein ParE